VIEPPDEFLASLRRSTYEFDILYDLSIFLSNLKSVKKYLVKGAVANMHCIIEFIKHVFPMFLRPIGV
jgi:hypothetical protein